MLTAISDDDRQNPTREVDVSSFQEARPVAAYGRNDVWIHDIKSAALHHLFGAMAFASVGTVPARAAGASVDAGVQPRLALVKFARCVAAKDRAQSSALVLSEPGSGQEAASLAALAEAMAVCNKGEASPDATRRPLLRGALAEQLWTSSVARFDGSAVTPGTANSVNFDAGFEAAPALMSQYRVAFCVAYTQPDLVDALVRTKPGSTSERSAFTVLVPALSACMQKNEVASFDPRLTRVLVAEQLYRRYVPQNVRFRAGQLASPAD